MGLPTVRELVGPAAEWLGGKGVPSPRLDADRLLAHVLGLQRLDLYLDLERPLIPAEVDQFRELVRRRGRREPLAYLLGSWSFRGLELAVDARVLVPRPETEWLVEQALRRIADATVTATDVSADALSLARQNASLHDAAIDFRQGDLLAPVAGSLFDLVLANLPYVGDGDEVDPEVSGFEPALAVYAPDAGRALIERLIGEVGAALAPGGVLSLELGSEHAPWALARLTEAGLLEAEPEPDLAGVERLVFARQPTS
jgi:release factor glutamine methyltransferase